MNPCATEDCTNHAATGDHTANYCEPCLRFGLAMLLGLDINFASRLMDHHTGPVELTIALIDDRGVRVTSATTNLNVTPTVFGQTFHTTTDNWKDDE
jgi:hypothetical protein